MQNVKEHVRKFPYAPCTMGAHKQLKVSRLIWLAAATQGWNHCSFAEGDGIYQLSVQFAKKDDKDDDVVQSMRGLTREEFASRDYVYDLTTGNDHFSAGAGTMVVHNTDYVFFYV